MRVIYIEVFGGLVDNSVYVACQRAREQGTGLTKVSPSEYGQ